MLHLPPRLPLFTEFITDTGPIYININHVIYVRPKPGNPDKSLIELTHPVPDEVGYVIVNHSHIDVILRLYKGME